MPLPLEIQTLRQLIQRKNSLESDELTLRARRRDLDLDFQTLFASGSLGVNEQNPIRIVHVANGPSGKVRFIVVRWVAFVNGVNQADASLVDVDEDA